MPTATCSRSSRARASGAWLPAGPAPIRWKLGSGTSAGVISQIGSQFTGFEVLAVDAGAYWVATGVDALAAGGTLSIGSGGVLMVDGDLTAPSLTFTGTGTLGITGGGTIEIGSSAAATANELLVDAGSTLFTGTGVLAVPTLVNKGSIANTTGSGIDLANGAAVSNSGTAASISGYTDGVFATGASAATVTNQGSIIASAVEGSGVYLVAGGAVTNSGTGAFISAIYNGIAIPVAAGSVVNQGTVTATGTNGFGVYLKAGGNVTNSGAKALISAGDDGIDSKGMAIVSNHGTISGTSYGINTLPSTNGSTIVNYGLISGGTAAVQFGGSNGNVFHAFPGSTTDGVVEGTIGTDTLELGSAASAGAVSLIGSHYTGLRSSRSMPARPGRRAGRTRWRRAARSMSTPVGCCR